MEEVDDALDVLDEVLDELDDEVLDDVEELTLEELVLDVLEERLELLAAPSEPPPPPPQAATPLATLTSNRYCNNRDMLSPGCCWPARSDRGCRRRAGKGVSLCGLFPLSTQRRPVSLTQTLNELDEWFRHK